MLTLSAYHDKGKCRTKLHKQVLLNNTATVFGFELYILVY